MRVTSSSLETATVGRKLHATASSLARPLHAPGGAAVWRGTCVGFQGHTGSILAVKMYLLNMLSRLAAFADAGKVISNVINEFAEVEVPQ